MRAREAVREDAHGGYEERIRFIGAPGAELFTCLHRPLGDISSALLICPPTFADFTKNYPREVWLARDLAARGVAVLRFHYRFTGNSDGSIEDLTFESMLDDAHRMLDLLVDASGPAELMTLGTRLSSRVAASVLRTSGAPGSIVLWEPTLDRDRYFRDAFRMASMSTASNREQQTTPREMQEHLLQEGWVDVLGDIIPKAIHDGSADTAWRTELHEVARRVLVVQLTKGSPRREHEAFIDDLRNRDVDAELQVCGFQEAWWFSDPESPAGREAVDISVGWAEREGLTKVSVGEEVP